jgi:fructose-1,6-bisphosphatase/inositol monophosphatase family enzyme
MSLTVPDSETVEGLIREVTAAEIMPRFDALADEEHWEKRPGSIVTAADMAAEAFLARELPRLLEGSVVVGEEMVEEDPTILDLLDGEAPVWVLDPVDGTSNFAKGSPDFGVMVALVHRREVIAGWIFRPTEHAMYVAEHGAGAFRNGERLRVGSAPTELAALEGSLGGRIRRETDLPKLLGRVTSTRCIAVDYCSLATGKIHFAHYRGTRVWDHAPGFLLHMEAGGFSRCLDGKDYRLGLPGEGGLLLTADEAAWHCLRPPIQDALDVLFG